MSYPERDMQEGQEVPQPHESDPLDLTNHKVLELLKTNRIFRDAYEKNKAIIEAIAKDESSARKATAESALLLLEMAGIDPLIEGFHNRRGFYDQLEKEIERAKRDGHPLSVVTFDLDHFKEVNDTFGHLEGDATLQRVGGEIIQIIRHIDYPARMGGDEFGLILPETSAFHALIPAMRLLEVVQNAAPVDSSGKPALLTASIGIAQANPSDTPQSLFKIADQAVYHAKQGGGTICLAEGRVPLSPNIVGRTLQDDPALSPQTKDGIIPKIVAHTIILPRKY